MLKASDYLLLIVLVAGVSFITVRFASPHVPNAAASAAAAPMAMPSMQQQSQPIIISQGGDDRYTIAPRPQRQWQTEYEVPTRGSISQGAYALGVHGSRGGLDTIYSRGPPETYQQMGIVTAGDKLLPLYGRRVAPRSDYFNYYTRTDTYNPVQLPISFKRKDCQDNAGCAEVSSGDEVHIRPTGETAKVTLYGFDGPRYT